MRRVAVIIGAGYSYVAGLPLTRDLLTTPVYVPSQRAEDRWEQVYSHYLGWKAENPSGGPEQYLGYLYSHSDFGWESQLWPAAVELVAATLATPRPGDMLPNNLRYSEKVSRTYHCAAHREFWSTLFQSTEVIGVMTTNYDLLVERSLRHRPMAGRPGCYYGGFPFPQTIEGAVENDMRPRHLQRPLEFTGRVPVFKIHGSLNWALSEGKVVICPDARPAFRAKGKCAIIPPIPEKEPPNWLLPVWEAAESCLSQADDWIVCGYSLPDYDRAIRLMLQRAIGDHPKRMFVLDPDSATLGERWNQLGSCQVVALAGLPEGLSSLREYL
jgi:hypothetical protein